MNTIVNTPQVVDAFYTRDLLERAVPNFVYVKMAQVSRDIPKNNGTVIRWRKYGSLTAATTALTEGVTPAGSLAVPTDISATVLQYGDYITFTDKLEYTVEEPFLNEINEMQGEQSGDTLDQVCRDTIVAGTSILYANGRAGRTSVAAGDVINLGEVRKITRTLRNNNAKVIKEMISPTDRVSTAAVRAAYMAIAHPNTEYDIENIAGFIPVANYPSQAGVMDEEIGSVGNVRFIRTTNAKVFTAGGAGSIDVYATMVIGKNAYGVSRIAGAGMENIFHARGSAGAADPLNQRGSKGWKAMFVAKILQENFQLRFEHAVSS